MAVSSLVLRKTIPDLATDASPKIMGAYHSGDLITTAAVQTGKAIKSSSEGWGAAPETQVGRAIEALDGITDLASHDGTRNVIIARELLANTLTGRQNNASEVVDARTGMLKTAETALLQAQLAEVLAKTAM